MKWAQQHHQFITRLLDILAFLYLDITVLSLANSVVVSLPVQWEQSKCGQWNKKSAMSALCTNKARLIWANKVLAETLRQLQRGRTTGAVPLAGFRLIYNWKIYLAWLFYFPWCLSIKGRNVIWCRNCMMDGLIKEICDAPKTKRILLMQQQGDLCATMSR